MADPFSIATGIIGLVETGTSLASFLTDKYKAYRDAPEQILEIAHEVEFCAGLIEIFQHGVEKRGGVAKVRGERFQSDAGNLVRRTQKVFQEIRDLIPSDTNGLRDNYRARWHYMVDKKKLSDKQQRLRELQQMFMFMETMYRYSGEENKSSDPSPNSNIKDPGLSTTGNGANSLQTIALDLEGGTFEGIVSPQQVQNAKGLEDGIAQQFLATLTLKPMPKPQLMSETVELEPRMGGRLSSTENDRKKKKLQKMQDDQKRQSRLRLENLRRSPYFRPELLQPEISTRSWFGPSAPVYAPVPEYSQATTYSDAVDIEPIQFEGAQVESEAEDEEETEEEKATRIRKEICSKDEAKRDVEGWFEKWFENEDGSASTSIEGGQPGGDPTIIEPYPPPEPEQELGARSVDRYPWDDESPVSFYGVPEASPQPRMQPPLPQPRSARYQRNDLAQRRRTSPPSVTSSSSATASSYLQRQAPPHLRWRCSRCNVAQLNGTKHHCLNCHDPGYDLCDSCYNRNGRSWDHPHPKKSFVALIPAPEMQLY